MVLSEGGDVVAEVVGGGAKAMHQENRRPDGLLGGPAQAVHGMAQVAPALGRHGARTTFRATHHTTAH